MTGVHADQVLSCEIRQSGAPTPLPAVPTALKIKVPTARQTSHEKTKITMTVPAKRILQTDVEPACPARHAAARLRRASVRPILAAPPVRPIQASFLPKSKGRTDTFALDCGGESLYKERNHWLVLTRPLTHWYARQPCRGESRQVLRACQPPQSNLAEVGLSDHPSRQMRIPNDRRRFVPGTWSPPGFPVHLACRPLRTLLSSCVGHCPVRAVT